MSRVNPATDDSVLHQLHLNLTNQTNDKLERYIDIAAIDDLNARNCGKTLLHSAVYGGKITAANALLKAGADANAINTITHFTPLHTAAHHGEEGLTALLLQYSANPNATNFGDNTALHLAAQIGNNEIVSLLLLAGANPRAVNNQGKDALHVALMQGHHYTSLLLLAAGAEPESAAQCIQSQNYYTTDPNMHRVELIIKTLTSHSVCEFNRLIKKLSESEISIVLKPLLKQFIKLHTIARTTRRPSIFNRNKRTACETIADQLYIYVADDQHSNQLTLTAEQEKRLRQGTLHLLFNALRETKPDLQIAVESPPRRSHCSHTCRHSS